MSFERFPHDKFFRRSMQRIEVVKDFFAFHLPKNILEKMDLSTVRFEKTSFITDREKISGSKQEKIVDLLYSVKCNQDDSYIYLLSEQQSTPDRKMPLRIMKYMMEIIQYHFDKQDSDSNTYVSIIWPLIFYNGSVPYNFSTSFLDMYSKKHRELASNILTNSFQLVDLNNIEDKDLRDHVWTGIMEIAMKANLARFKNDIESLAMIMAKFVQDIISKHNSWDYIKDAVCYTMQVADAKSVAPESYLEIIGRELSVKSRNKVMTLAERLEERGREKGRQEGQQEGRKEVTQNIALNMLLKGFSYDDISALTGCTMDDIVKLQAQNERMFSKVD